MKKTLLVAASLLGIAGASMQPAPACTAAQTAAFGGGFDVGGALLRQRSGHSPKDWGMSKACAQMRRKNRMIRAGISCAKI